MIRDACRSVAQHIAGPRKVAGMLPAFMVLIVLGAGTSLPSADLLGPDDGETASKQGLLLLSSGHSRFAVEAPLSQEQTAFDREAMIERITQEADISSQQAAAACALPSCAGLRRIAARIRWRRGVASQGETS